MALTIVVSCNNDDGDCDDDEHDDVGDDIGQKWRNTDGDDGNDG